MAAPGPQVAPQAAPQGRGNRGMAHTNTLPPGWTPPAGAPAQAAPQARGNRSDNRSNNFQGNNRGNGNPGAAGQRRDFSSFREFHRDFNASRRFRAPAYRRPTGWYDHRWSFGEFLPRTYWVRDYWLDNFAAYGLPPPPYGAVWVRVGSDALLVDEYSGEVITVEYSVFY
jgi:Ni/Co efflux regulator RcnB